MGNKNTKVLIAVPSYFHIDPHFHQCLLKLSQWLAIQPKEEIEGEIIHSFGDSPHVGRSRNMLTRKFLEGDYTELLFIDSDIVFGVNNVRRILAHKEEVVGGVYFKKSDDQPEACINGIKNPIIREDGLIQVAYIGTGFLRIKRCVFEEMIAHWGHEMAYCPDGSADIVEYSFWNLAMHTYSDEQVAFDTSRIENLMKKYGINRDTALKAIKTRWLSEDWWFCQKCLALGIKVWADRGIPLRHSGNILYPLRTQEETIFENRKVPDNADAPALVSPPVAASA